MQETPDLKDTWDLLKVWALQTPLFFFIVAVSVLIIFWITLSVLKDVVIWFIIRVFPYLIPFALYLMIPYYPIMWEWGKVNGNLFSDFIKLQLSLPQKEHNNQV